VFDCARLLDRLLRPGPGGKTRLLHDSASIARARNRKDVGPAHRVGQLLESVVALTNERRGWTKDDRLTVKECIARAPEGQALERAMADLQTQAGNEQLWRDNSLALAAARGGAMTETVIGYLSHGMKAAEAAVVFGVSETTVRRSRDHVALTKLVPTAAGPFSTLQQRPGGHRQRLGPRERHVTEAWFLSQNPSRSGDTTPIAWMILGKVDFYFDSYRGNYRSLMEMAFKMYPELKTELRGREAKNQWERNLQLYLRDKNTATKGVQLAHRNPLTSVLARMANEVGDGSADDLPASVDAQIDEAGHDDDVFVPRSYDCFYFNLLKKTNIRKRPPEKYCDMCETGPGFKAELATLNIMLAPPPADSDSSDVQEDDHEAWKWRKYGTRQKAVTRKRELQRMVFAREQHAVWYRIQRPEVQCSYFFSIIIGRVEVGRRCFGESLVGSAVTTHIHVVCA
jgi:hypothetical protein